MGKSIYKLFAVSPPGLESFTQKELEALGIRGEMVKGGLDFKGGLEELYKANLFLRTATRILLRVAIFKATTFKELVERVSRYPWEIYIRPDVPVKFRVTSRRSKLYHTKAIEERIIRGIMQRVKFEPLIAETEEEGESVIVKVERDKFTISVNSSGAMLYKRGYKKLVGEAPLRENMAASMLLAAEWDKSMPLVDPFCGSGTICIEAALMCKNIPPGAFREFAFEKWRIHDPQLWEKIKEEALSNIRECKVAVEGFDISKKAIEMARENALRANVQDCTNFAQGSFPRLPFKEAFVVTNPPYGIRISTAKTQEVYRNLGRWIRENFSRAKIAILSPMKKFVETTELPLEKVTSFSHGGIRVGLYVGEILKI